MINLYVTKIFKLLNFILKVNLLKILLKIIKK